MFGCLRAAAFVLDGDGRMRSAQHHILRHGGGHIFPGLSASAIPMMPFITVEIAQQALLQCDLTEENRRPKSLFRSLRAIMKRECTTMTFVALVRS